MMRENTTFWQKLFFSYAQPLLKSSITQQIKFEQYGELPDRLLIKHEEAKLEASIGHYLAKDQQDRFAFCKGLVAINKFNFAKFAAIRVALTSNEFIVPYIMTYVLEWVQSGVEEPLTDTLQMVALGMSIPAIQIAAHLIWEYFCYLNTNVFDFIHF